MVNPRILHQKKKTVPHTPAISLKSEVSITLCCQLCSTRYTALQIKVQKVPLQSK